MLVDADHDFAQNQIKRSGNRLAETEKKLQKALTELAIAKCVINSSPRRLMQELTKRKLVTELEIDL